MPTLELTLQRKTDSVYPVVAALARPGGFLPLRREGMLILDIAALAELQYEPLAYGTALGQSLFVDEIRDTFVKALGDEPLRVLLSLEAPDLRALDWHRLAAPFDGRWRFLASQQNTPFSLAVPSPASAHFPAIGRRDLRALILVAGPETLSGDFKLATFDVPATLAGIQESLGDIPCDILQNPSLDALCAALTQTPYTFLHLVCHGAVNQSGETVLYFPKDTKGGPTPASELLNRLGSLARLPHFAFIAACESALPQNGLGSLAGRFVRELGLPAVLAMTDRVSIATASAIAAPFYAHLYQHGQPDLALAQSLAGLQGAHDLTVPAIFSRLGDRPLFDDNAERALTDKELEFGFDKLAQALPERAPVMDSLRDSLTRRLRSTLGTDSKSLSESSRTERKETLDQLNSLSLEALDLSFNALCLGQTLPAYDSRSPFRGLESFRPEDAAYFFGREALTKRLVQKLNEHNFLAVLGASGSGKSSLVMAGLIPALNVPYAVCRPGAEPLAELDKAIQLAPQLLVVDQFEELFTLSAREQRSDFISRLLEQSDKIRVVITLRADFLGEVAPFKLLKDEVQNHQEIIPPMDEAELRRAMEGQAACAGLRFESDLSQQMLDDVSGEPGAMPLLQHALWTLWTRRHGRWLRAEEYRAFGGVKQAIASTAEAVFARCNDFEKERLRDIFLRLTRLDEGTNGRDTRRRALLRDLIPADSDPAATTLLIKQLADARLVVVTGDEVEVAHEALIRNWERLRAWLNDDRDNLRLREGVSDDARRWENAARDESLLNHRGPRLELALAMSENPRYRLNPVEQVYLDASVALREREKAAVAIRKRYAIAGISAAIVVVIAILAAWSWTNSLNTIELSNQVATAEAAFATSQAAQAKAEEQTYVAFLNELSSKSQFMFAKDKSHQTVALLLAIQSMKLAPSSDVAQILQSNMLAYPISYIEHDNPVNFISFTPNGKYVVSSSSNGIIKTWEPITGNIVTRIVNDSAIDSIAFSPDSRYIVFGSRDGTVQVWDIVTGKEIARMTHDSDVNSVAFSHDGKTIVSGSSDKTIRLWNPYTGEEINKMVRNYTVNSVAFSSDGIHLISGGNGELVLWNLTTGEVVTSIEDSGDVNFVGFSPNGNSFYVITDYTISVWDIATMEKISHISYEYRIEVTSISSNGNYIITGACEYVGEESGCPYGMAIIWDLNTGQRVASMPHDRFVSSVAFSADNKHVISSSQDYDGVRVRVWDVDTGNEIARILYEEEILSTSFSPDGKLIAIGSADATARIWKIPTGNEVARLLYSGETRSVFFNANGTYLLSNGCDLPFGYFCNLSTVRVWNVVDNYEIVRKSYDLQWVFAVAFNKNNNYVASSGQDGVIQVWDALSGAEIDQLHHDDWVLSVTFSSDGKYLVSGSKDNTIRVWDLPTGKELIRMLHDAPVHVVAISPNDKYIVSGSFDDTARVWDIATGKEISRISHESSVYSVAFSPDSKYVASAGDSHNVLVWDAVTGRKISKLAHDDSVKSVVFSPDGKYLVSTGRDNTARVWEIHTGREIARMNHNLDVVAAVFSPDGKYIASGSGDRTVRVWDAISGQEIFRMQHEDFVSSVAFSPDGKHIASGGGDGAIRIWIWQPGELISDACSRLPQNLTRSEWKQYIGDLLPYQVICPNLPIEPEPTP